MTVPGKHGPVMLGSIATLAIDSGPFDLAFLDPPYDTPAADVESVLRRLIEGEWLTDGATVVVERGASSSPLVWPAGWGSTWERCYGDTLVLFAQRK